MYLKYKYKVKKCTWSTDKSTLSISNRYNRYTDLFLLADAMSETCGLVAIYRFVSMSENCGLVACGDCGDFRIIYAGGVCVFSQSGRVISTETDECSQTTAEWLLLGVTLTEIAERQRRCLVQRMIDTTAKNCNANYSVFSRFPHGLVVNKFCCPALYFYYVWTCLNLSHG